MSHWIDPTVLVVNFILVPEMSWKLDHCRVRVHSLCPASCGLVWLLPLGSVSTPSAVCCPGMRCHRSSGVSLPGCFLPNRLRSSTYLLKNVSSIYVQHNYVCLAHVTCQYLCDGGSFDLASVPNMRASTQINKRTTSLSQTIRHSQI